MEITSRTFEEDEKGRELVLTITATAEDVDAAVDKYFEGLKELEVPGFRKGKAPRAVMEQGVGGHEKAYSDAAEQLMKSTGLKTIDDADVIFISDPEFNVDGELTDHKPFTFTVSGMVPPEMNLTSYDPVSIEMPPEKATETEIDHQLGVLREAYHTLKDIDDPDHVAAMGDYVMMTVTCTKSDGGAIQGLTGVERLVGLGKGTMPISFDEHIVGCKAGDTVAFDFDARGEKEIPQFGDGILHAECDIKSFRACILPELDDAFAQKLGSDTYETLRQAVAQALNNDKKQHLPQVMEDRAVAALIDRIDGEIPRYYVSFIGQSVSQEYVRELEKEGTSLQEWIIKNKVDREEIREQIETMAYHRAACDVALEALFREKGWEITTEDVDREFSVAEDGEEAKKQWYDNYAMAEFRKRMRQARAANWLVDTAEVTVVEEFDD